MAAQIGTAQGYHLSVVILRDSDTIRVQDQRRHGDLRWREPSRPPGDGDQVLAVVDACGPSA
jgi:hypothetical protein